MRLSNHMAAAVLIVLLRSPLSTVAAPAGRDHTQRSYTTCTVKYNQESYLAFDPIIRRTVSALSFRK